MGFSRQEYWSRLPCPSPGDLLDPGVETASPVLACPVLAGGTFTEPQGALLTEGAGLFLSCVTAFALLCYCLITGLLPPLLQAGLPKGSSSAVLAGGAKFHTVD